MALVGGYGSGSGSGSGSDDNAAPAAAAMLMPALAQGLMVEEDEDSDDAAPAAPEEEEEEDDDGPSGLPSIDDALDAAGPSEFLPQRSTEVSYGNILDEVPRERAAAAPDDGAAGQAAGAAGGKVPAFPERPPKKEETNRQKNARKEKAGQATFSLKWDRDCGAEKAPGGAEGKGKGGGKDGGKGGKGGGKGGKGEETLKDRTKNKRKLDQSASFLGGRWKTEEEMHMRDNFDS